MSLFYVASLGPNSNATKLLDIANLDCTSVTNLPKLLRSSENRM